MSVLDRLPITLHDVKKYLRVTHHEDDMHIQMLTGSATNLLEIRTKRDFITNTRTFERPAFPGSRAIRLSDSVARHWTNYIELPIIPVQQVDQIQYYDEANQLQTLSTNVYSTYTLNGFTRIIAAIDQTFPATANRPDAVIISYTTGYGSLPEDVPEVMRHAVLLLVRHWYDNPSAVVTGTISKEIEYSLSHIEWAISSGYYAQA